VVDGGYSVALLLDAWLTLARPDLRTSGRRAAKTATITGASTAVADFVRTLEAPDRSEVLGPLQVEEQTVRAVVRCPREDSAALVAALKVAQSIRSARKDPTVRVQVDPHELG
jgi:primosomal protein N' (replication factor Y)